MSKAAAERDATLSKLTSMLFSAMVNDVVLDTTLQSHHEVQKADTLCDICHTRCGSAHASSSVTVPNSQAGSPDGVSQTNASGSATAVSTPTNSKPDGNVYFECLNCKRQIASNRYAPHLSSCMGAGNGNRRGASRSTVVKKKMSVEPGRSASPYPASEGGNASDDSKSVKGKSKAKTARKEDGEFPLRRKRPGSPTLSPKIPKKAKTSGSPLKHSTDVMPPPLTKKPSKLRDSSVVSDLIRDREGSASASVDNDSRVSVFSPEATPVTPTSSGGSPTNSATFTNGNSKNGSAKPRPGTAAKSRPAKSVTPSRPQPVAVHQMPDPNFLDYGGEETGSSTDSESD